MTHASTAPFVSIGQILAEKVLPPLHRAQKLPLRVSCLGTISYAGPPTPTAVTGPFRSATRRPLKTP